MRHRGQTHHAREGRGQPRGGAREAHRCGPGGHGRDLRGWLPERGHRYQHSQPVQGPGSLQVGVTSRSSARPATQRPGAHHRLGPSRGGFATLTISTPRHYKFIIVTLSLRYVCHFIHGKIGSRIHSEKFLTKKRDECFTLITATANRNLLITIIIKFMTDVKNYISGFWRTMACLRLSSTPRRLAVSSWTSTSRGSRFKTLQYFSRLTTRV